MGHFLWQLDIGIANDADEWSLRLYQHIYPSDIHGDNPRHKEPDGDARRKHEFRIHAESHELERDCNDAPHRSDNKRFND